MMAAGGKWFAGRRPFVFWSIAPPERRANLDAQLTA